MSSEPLRGTAQRAPKALTLEAEAQQVLDELWKEEQIPFKLYVGKITKGVIEYTIHFYDSRICTAYVPLTKRQLFREMVRTAVLARVARMSSPLGGWQKDDPD